ncbi:shikimate dehydrogenase [Campylobacter sp. JMF_02 ED1]|uniref:shikimate dehydrogenase n=1 Tax=Campylobacter sp. JMF_02 ED1 TaxID=2983826 RepID=UPI0022E99995|nr:shikimate dehydrogenase [Campylobacter sp. JMF_02 ED1]MDA3051782.1 shikimate dehydrogenase [Campylobacter sp. JMF_02 ED1]
MHKFAVFGNPISHSISPLMHNLAIKELGLDAFYGRVLLKTATDLKQKFLNLGLNGANITVPFKLEAHRISDELSEAAREIGSVNTLVRKNSKFYGYNTDAPGFYEAIREFGSLKRVLVLGAGGTTRAIGYILAKNGVKFDILNRSEKEPENFKCENFYTYENFKFQSYDLVVNSTSAGLKDDFLPAPAEILDAVFKEAKFAFDAIYGKITPFLDLASTHGVRTKDGREMLINQGALAFNLFYDNKFDTAQIAEFMARAVSLKG